VKNTVALSLTICKRTYVKLIWTEESCMHIYRKSQMSFNNKQSACMRSSNCTDSEISPRGRKTTTCYRTSRGKQKRYALYSAAVPTFSCHCSALL